MAEGDTWESRENLENAGDLLKEFEEEYRRDNREGDRKKQRRTKTTREELCLGDTPPGNYLDGQMANMIANTRKGWKGIGGNRRT